MHLEIFYLHSHSSKKYAKFFAISYYVIPCTSETYGGLYYNIIVDLYVLNFAFNVFGVLIRSLINHVTDHVVL